MDVGYALLCGLLVELADLGLAVASDLEEALGELDGFKFGFGLDEGEAADELFGFGEGAVGDGEVAAGGADARAEGRGEAAFGGEQEAFFKGLLDKLAHGFHHFRGGWGAFFGGGFIDAQKSHWFSLVQV